MKRFTIADLAAWKKAGKRFAMLTSYDSVTASVFDGAGVPVLLVGDSAGNNFLGSAANSGEEAHRPGDIKSHL